MESRVEHCGWCGKERIVEVDDWCDINTDGFLCDRCIKIRLQAGDLLNQVADLLNPNSMGLFSEPMNDMKALFDHMNTLYEAAGLLKSAMWSGRDYSVINEILEKAGEG